MLVRIAKREVSDETVLKKQSDLDLCSLYIGPVGSQLVFKVLEQVLCLCEVLGVTC